jgi:DNA-binding Xre family transcriptional regulator
MKTYYDIAIHTASKDVVNIKGVSYSQMMKIANDNPKLIKVEILKEYSKKISKY